MKVNKSSNSFCPRGTCCAPLDICVLIDHFKMLLGKRKRAARKWVESLASHDGSVKTWSIYIFRGPLFICSIGGFTRDRFTKPNWVFRVRDSSPVGQNIFNTITWWIKAEGTCLWNFRSEIRFVWYRPHWNLDLEARENARRGRSDDRSCPRQLNFKVCRMSFLCR